MTAPEPEFRLSTPEEEEDMECAFDGPCARCDAMVSGHLCDHCGDGPEFFVRVKVPE